MIKHRKWTVALLLALIALATIAGPALAQEEGPTAAELGVAIDTVWVLLAGVLVFFMQAGFGFLEAGFVPSKHVANILMENFIDTCVTGLTFWAFGFALMFGAGNLFFGHQFFFMRGLGGTDAFGIPGYAFWFFQFAFSAAASTITSGAMAGRTKFVADLVYSAFLSGIIYAIVGHWIWGGGWLGQLGFKDFAGSTVVHSVGGWAGLMGALGLGARLGRFNADGTANEIPGHNISLAALGTFVLWFGWYGFNPGSTLGATYPGAANDIALITVNTTLAAAAGAFAALFLQWWRTGWPDVGMSLNGALAGLVSVTAPCAWVSPLAAVIIGVMGGILVVYGMALLEKLRIDDPVGAVAVHGICGVWGTLSIGLFDVTDGLLYGGGVTQIGIQLLGAVAVFIFVTISMGLAFQVIKATIGLRIHREGEVAGLDITEHGVISYPEFGTTIVHTVTGEVAMAPGSASAHG
ncbi:MAG: ammonium transporter [Anaerolineae bacterium]